MQHYFRIILAAVLVIPAFTACDDDTPQIINEEELITTLIVTFAEQGSTSTIYTLRAEDIDGDGTIDDVSRDTLPANTDFNVTFRVRNDIDNEEVTDEVEAESDEHLVCYTPSGLNLNVTITDADGNGDPLGLEASASTGAASTGSLRIQLRHEPVKNAVDPCATGEADVEYTFTNLVIQ